MRELLRSARSLPPHEQMVIEDLDDHECCLPGRPTGVSVHLGRGPIVIDTDVFGADFRPSFRSG